MLYPETLEQILAYIRHLNDAEGDVMELSMKTGIDAIGLDDIKVIDGSGNHIGWLVDEVGGAWAFTQTKPVVGG
jgi:hypothetical protein